MRRFRYTGSVPVVFSPPVGAVDPGVEFDVPDEHGPSFAQHGLLEEVSIKKTEKKPPTVTPVEQ